MRLFNINSIDFLEMDLSVYMKFVVLNFIIECSNNILLFKNLDIDIHEHLILYKNKNPSIHCHHLTDREYYDLCKISKTLHKNYIYNKFLTEKKRVVYSIKEEFTFVKNSHFLFSYLNDKIFNYDFFKLNGIKYHSLDIIDDHSVAKKQNIKEEKYWIKNNRRKVLYSNVSYVKISSQKKALSDYSNFKMKCSGGVSSSSINSAKLHNPAGMATFDIQGFFSSFTVNKIKEHNLFLNIFKYGNSNSSKLKKINDIFIGLCSAFFYDDILPTGALFSSHISNLLFFSVDSLIFGKIKEITHERFYEKFPFSTETKIIQYTRYVDDIAISINVKGIESLFYCNALTNSWTYNTFTYEDLRIGMPEILEIEKILNSNGFFIKYDKTKIFSPKSPKYYLGLTYVPSVQSRNYPSFIPADICKKHGITISHFSNVLSISKKYRKNLSKSIINYKDNYSEELSMIGRYQYMKNVNSFNLNRHLDKILSLIVKVNPSLFEKFKKIKDRKKIVRKKIKEIKVKNYVFPRLSSNVE